MFGVWAGVWVVVTGQGWCLGGGYGSGLVSGWWLRVRAGVWVVVTSQGWCLGGGYGSGLVSGWWLRQSLHGVGMDVKVEGMRQNTALATCSEVKTTG